MITGHNNGKIKTSEKIKGLATFCGYFFFWLFLPFCYVIFLSPLAEYSVISIILCVLLLVAVCVIYWFWSNPSQKSRLIATATIEAMEEDLKRSKALGSLVALGQVSLVASGQIASSGITKPIFFKRSYTKGFISGDVLTGTLYLTSDSILYASEKTYEYFYDDIGFIKYFSEEDSELPERPYATDLYNALRPYKIQAIPMKVMLRNDKNVYLTIPGATEVMMDLFMKALLFAHKHNSPVFDIPEDNECPRCGALLKDGRCEYCRWQAPLKQVPFSDGSKRKATTKEVSLLNETDELPAPLATDLMSDSQVYFEQNCVIFKNNKSPETSGKLYLTSDGIVFVGKSVMTFTWGDFKKINIFDSRNDDSTIKVHLKNNEVFKLVVPSTSAKTMKLYCDKLTQLYCQLVAKNDQLTKDAQICPYCKAVLKEGRCEYCRSA